MSKASGYSLWLVPNADSKLRSTLVRCIAEISAEYQTPNFAPHATLLPEVDGDEKKLQDKTQKLAGLLKPYEMLLGEICSNGKYFQILFSKIKQADAVMRANAQAQKVFEVDKGIYFPHVSLAYGNFSSEEVDTLRTEITQRGHSISGEKFMVHEIELWRTNGPVQDWYKVAAFSLRS